MEKHVLVECVSCGSPRARVAEEPKYRGLRSTCPECGSNWPES